MKQFLILALLLISLEFKASPIITTPFIRIDQFGYLCNSSKVAVIIDPQSGYNAADSYSPGTNPGQYQLRRWDNDAVVFTGTLANWNNGATQEQSGDKGWWFDFSIVTAPGSYYIFDLGTGKGSYRFDIGSNVYADVLKQASRMFYYQRSNFAKANPYADPKWTDAAAFDGALQDRNARSRWDKNNAASGRDVSGGWFDAGDLNKYVTFTVEPLTQLMEVYRLHPSIFKEDLNLPESSNGIPDILDEVKYEIDWLIKMQDATGTNGLMLKVGSDNFNVYSPPSTDINKRYYVPECTSSTISGAVVFALASTIYRSLNNPVMTKFADELKQRAINAWERVQTTSYNFTVFQTDCDDENIIAGDADENSSWQKQCAITAAIYLYEATGSTVYKNYVEKNYNSVEPVGTGWWGPYRLFIQKALLRYTQLAGVSTTVVNAIRTSKQNTNTTMSLPEYNSSKDLYRAYMPDAQYTWESNMPRSACGVTAQDFVHYGINNNNHPLYKEMAEQYLHWFHGTNAQGIVMLSNMYAYGADSSVNEIYHTWFGHNTIFDNAKTSPRGPAPGYVTGGPNRTFTVLSLSPPANQPPQKTYKDWNTNWNGQFNENSFEITEPTIYCQAMYIELLAAVIDYGTTNCITPPVDNSAPGALNYKLYQGSFSSLPDFNGMTPVSSGTSLNTDITKRPAGLNDNFAFIWEGNININTPGSYTFETISDDGSKLYFNTTYSAGAVPLVTNDGLHAANSATGTVTIPSAGSYPIAITYFEATGGETMQVYWTGPGITRQQVPNNAFSTTGTPPATTGRLNYKYYEGAFTALPDFSALSAVKTGTTSNVDISVRNAAVNDNFAFVWEGYINITTPGAYTFETVSDDGSKLYFNSFYSAGTTALVNNDGLHATIAATGNVTVATAGTYPIAITYFDATGGETMQVYWTGPGIARQLIPNNAFRATGTPPVITGGVNYKYYEGTFTSLPDFTALTPVKTGTGSVADINVRPSGANDHFAFLWEGSITITTPGIYTFETVSDDGSKLYFNSYYSAGASALVSNDGLHAVTSATGTVAISSAGVYPIAVTFFEATGGEVMQVYWTGPGIARQLIPGSAFTPASAGSSGMVFSQNPGYISQAAEFSNRVLEIYPNPFAGSFVININNTSINNEIGVEVFDVSGRIVYKQHLGNVAAGKTTVSVNPGNKISRPGLYFVKMKVNGVEEKVVKIVRRYVP